VHFKSNRLSEAEEVLKEVVGTRERVLKADDPRLATSLANLGTVFAAQGREAEAETLYKQALHKWRQHWGRSSSDVASGLQRLANHGRRQARRRDACWPRCRPKRVTSRWAADSSLCPIRAWSRIVLLVSPASNVRVRVEVVKVSGATDLGTSFDANEDCSLMLKEAVY